MASLSPTPPHHIVPPTRADARRNFERLVAAADAVYTEQGVDAPLDEIAKRAGVGSGTLYRHFPNREALIGAVVWERIRAVCELGEELAEGSSGLEALRTWLRAMIALTMRRGLAQALLARSQATASELFAAAHHALYESARPLLKRAQAEGEIDAEVELTDLLTFANAIASSVEHSPDPEERAERMLELLFQGVASPPGPAPGRASEHR